MITITLKDIVTGETKSTEGWSGDVFWWTEGNGSCDCNRALVFDPEIDCAMEDEFGEGTCYGKQRFFAVDVSGNFEGLSKEELLAELNDGYPAQPSQTAGYEK